MLKVLAFATILMTHSLSAQSDIVHYLLNISIPKSQELLKIIGNPSKIEVPKKFHILVWNILKGQRSGWINDLDKMTHESEFIFLQEAKLNNEQLHYYNRVKDNYQWDMAQSFSRGDNKASSGVILGHKAKGLAPLVLRTDDTEPGINTPKTAVFNKFKIQGSSELLCVVNIHAINFVRPKIFKNQILKIEKVLKNCLGPILYAGDFNTWMARKLEILEQSASRLGLKAVTFKNDHRTKFTRWSPPFDHIFVRGIKVKASYVFGEITSSDHKPLSAYLEIL